jgi:HTH-type transcriptional regulator/antitoxin HigA
MYTTEQDIAAAKRLISPPGDTLKETIEHYGMSQLELATRMARPEPAISEIITGKKSITADTALQLEMVLGISADFWLERERQYRLELAAIERGEELLKQKDWVKQFPITDMIKHGWISSTTKDVFALTQQVLSYFGVASIEAYNNIYLSNKPTVAFRISLKKAPNHYALATWLRRGQLDAQQLALEAYNKKAFIKTLEDIKKLVEKQPVDFKEQLQLLCAKCGVAVVFTQNIKGVSISGAARWINDGQNPLIQLTGRYKTNDILWFTFFHEAGHIIEHGKKEVFLENVDGIPYNEDKEKEADAFAEKWLINPKAFNAFLAEENFTEKAIKTFAKQEATHPAIVVGRLQKFGYLRYNDFTSLKSIIELF